MQTTTSAAARQTIWYVIAHKSGCAFLMRIAITPIGIAKLSAPPRETLSKSVTRTPIMKARTDASSGAMPTERSRMW